MSEFTSKSPVGPALNDDTKKAKLITAAGIIGAIASSTCCIIPLVLFSLGISSAWVSQLTALSVYQPIFIAVTLGFIVYGYWLIYRKSNFNCSEGKACARPISNVIVKTGLWVATSLVLLAVVWPYLVPLIFE